MPTYEFRCPNGHEFEQFYKTMSTAPTLLPCSVCGAVAARQLSGGGGLVFKGSGFYLTDYGKNAHRGGAPEKHDDGGSAESAKAEGGKPEGGKAEGGKAEGGKAEGGKAEGGKTESGKTETATAKSETKGESSSRSESSKPRAQTSPPKPKSE